MYDNVGDKVVSLCHCCHVLLVGERGGRRSHWKLLSVLSKMWLEKLERLEITGVRGIGIGEAR